MTLAWPGRLWLDACCPGGAEVPFGPGAALVPVMRPLDLQVIGTELGIRWDDGSESFIPLLTLRRHCPCAACAGEKDILGNLYKGPGKPLTARSSEVIRLEPVGGYAVQPVWADGHNTGLYTYEYLRRLGALT